MIDPYASLEDLQVWARARMQRTPDFIIGDPANPYMLRWWIVPRNEGANVYLHHILRSDDDRALHDHPWDNTSMLIDGSYEEIVPIAQGHRELTLQDYQPDFCRRDRRQPGEVVTRKATDAHRLIVPEGGKPAISLFTTGPKIRDWGFWCPKGWVPWQDFTAGTQGELVGAGCD